MTAVLRRLALALAVLARLRAGRATVFGSPAWDGRTNPSADLACEWADARHRALRQLDEAHDAVVAHRTLPCGARVLLWNPVTGEATIARVGDRGPLRADIDMAPLVSRAVGLGRTGGALLFAPIDESSPAGALVRAAPPIRARRAVKIGIDRTTVQVHVAIQHGSG